MRRLHDATVAPIATPATKGAWFKHWRLVSIDGSTLDVPDEPALDAAFGRPGGGRGESAYPQIRFVSLVENGTHVLFGTRMDKYATGEIALALWRVKSDALLPREKVLPDGSYLSHIYPSTKDRRHKTNGVRVRVIEYRLEGRRRRRSDLSLGHHHSRS
jgi:hypothetical protein